MYAEGVRLVIVPTRRVPPQCVETRAKITSKMNQILAELEADVNGALSLMLDVDGNVAENAIANFLSFATASSCCSPERNVLEGITRKVVFELATRLGIPYEERNFTIYDLAQAGGIFPHHQRLLRPACSRSRWLPAQGPCPRTDHATTDERLCRRDRF